MGGSGSGSKSESESGFDQNVWRPQGEALQNLYGQMGDLWGQSGGLSGILQGLAGNLGGYNQGLMGRGAAGQEQMLGGGSFGDTSDARNALMQSMRQTGSGQTNMGDMYRSIVGGEGNTYIDPMVDAMKQGAMQNLQGMQSNAGLDASAAGQGGGSRHAMQNAMLGAQANRDMMTQEANMRGGAYDKDMAMKMRIAGMADSNVQNTQNRYMQMMGGADQNVGAGMGYGQGLQNLGMGSMAPYMQAYNAPWQMAGQYANTIGSPTVLGSGDSNSKAVGGSGGGGVKGGGSGGGGGGVSGTFGGM